MSVLWLFLTLTLVVVIHEYGHFFACRLLGVPVKTFAIGMGPTLFKWVSPKTSWEFKLLPFGGYISMHESVAERSPGARFLISAAGPAVNILVAMLIVGIAISPEKALDLLRIMGLLYVKTFQALFSVFVFTSDTVVASVAADDMRGPIGMAKDADQIKQSTGFLPLFLILNIGIALINLMPFPPLDGGHMVLQTVEATLGKRIGAMVAAVYVPISLLFFLALIVMITFRDIIR